MTKTQSPLAFTPNLDDGFGYVPAVGLNATRQSLGDSRNEAPLALTNPETPPDGCIEDIQVGVH